MESTSHLCIGDTISLYTAKDADNFYFNINGIQNFHCAVVQTTKQEPFPLNYRECLFQVIKAGQYQALKAFKKEIENAQIPFENFKLEQITDKTLKKKLSILEKEMKKEMDNNWQSNFVSNRGKPILYGDSVLLFHVQSQKYLTVAKQNSEIQKDALKIVLTSHPDRYAFFSILPSIKVKIEGEKIYFKDTFNIFHGKFGNNMNLGKYALKDGRLEVNMSSSSDPAKWKMNLYQKNSTNTHESDRLKSGIVIRIYHKEYEAYLMYDQDKDCLDLCSPKDLADFSTFSLWELEKDERANGGFINWNENILIRHLASNKYICLDPNKVIVHPKAETPLSRTDTMSGSSQFKKFGSSWGLMKGMLTKEPENEKSMKKRNSGMGWSTMKEKIPIPSPIEEKKTSAAWNFLKRKKSVMDQSKQGWGSVKDVGLEKRKSVKQTNGIGGWNSVKEKTSNSGKTGWSNLRRRAFGSLVETVDSVDVQLTQKHKTIWHFVNVQKNNNALAYESYVRFFEPHQQTWLHLEQEPEKKKEYKCSSQIRMNEEDVFSIKQVQDSEVTNILVVLSLMKPISNFVQSIEEDPEVISEDDLVPVFDSLSKLVSFIFDDYSDIPPMKKEGIPIVERQNTVRQLHLFDNVMNMISNSFEKKVVDERNVNKKKRKFGQAFEIGYKLLKICCRENTANGEYLYKYMNTIQNHLEYEIGAAECLLDIIKDNDKVLNQITEAQIDYFLDIILKGEGEASFVSYVTALCSYKNNPVIKNQEYILKKLLSDKRKARNILGTPWMQRGEIYLMCYEEEQSLEFFLDVSESVNEYLNQVIILLSQLCLGRNVKAIKVIQDIVEYETVEAFILNENPKMKSYLRKSFIELYINCHINIEPFERRPLYQLSRNLAEIKSDEEGEEKPSDGYQDQIELLIFRDMKKFFEEKFLKEHAIIEVNNLNENIYILEMLRLCRNMFEFSIYHGMEEVEGLVQPLMNIMNGNTDKKDGKVMSNSERFEDNPQNLIVMKIKIEICNIISLLFDLRLEGRIAKFIEFFKKKYDLNDISVVPEDEKFFKGLFQQVDFDFHGLQDILLDLSLYKNIELTTRVLHLIFRTNNQKSELADHLAQIELVSPKMISESKQIRGTFNGMKPLIYSTFTSMSKENKKKNALSIYGSNLEREMIRNRDRTQKILRNLGFHTTVFGALQQVTPKQITEEAVLPIFKLLKDFVCDNPTNQALVGEHFNLLIPLISEFESDDVIELLIETCKENRHVCSSIEEKTIQLYLRSISSKGKKPIYIDFLRMLIKPSKGESIKRNQFLVIKELLERKNNTILLFNDEDGLKKRNKLITEEEDKDPNGKLNYFMSLLLLLIDGTEGKAHFSELKMQTVFTLDDVLNQLLDPMTKKLPKLNNLLLLYLDEVFINTEKPNPKLPQNEKLWELFSRLITDIDDFTDDAPKHNYNSYYIFKVILQLFNHFIEDYKDLIPNEEYSKTPLFELITSLVTLHKEVCLPYHRELIENCLYQMKNIKDFFVAESDEFALSLIDNFLEEQSSHIKIKTIIRNPNKIEIDEDEAEQKFHLFFNLSRPFLENDNQFEKVASNLLYYINRGQKEFIEANIKLLKSLSVTSNWKSKDLVKIIKLLLKTLQHVLDLVKENGKKYKFSYSQLQEEFSKLGASSLVIDLMTSPIDDVVKEALEFGIKLLDEGNTRVQEDIYQSWKNDKTGSFFISIRRRIRNAIDIINEKHSIMQKKKKFQFEQEANLNILAIMQEEEGEDFDLGSNIVEIFRFLQLLCEGHNLKMQRYLGFQSENQISINLVQECLDFIFEIKKLINHNTIEIACQGFDTLTEFVQGPCDENQKILNTPKLYLLANEILENDFDPHSRKNNQVLKLIDALELKEKVLITLASVASEGRKPEIIDLMKNSLLLNIFEEKMMEIYSHVKTSEGKEKLMERIKNESSNRDLYKLGDIREDSNKLRDELVAREEDIGYHYYFLLKILSANEEKGGPTKSILETKINETTGLFDHYQKGSGQIEIIRNGELDRVYFRIPEICGNLSEETKAKFLENCSLDDPQEKVKQLFEQTRSFKSEMEYFSHLKKSTFFWRIIYPNFQNMNFIQLLITFISNLLLLFTYARVFDTSFDWPIPVPGVSNVPDGYQLRLQGDFTDPVSEVIFYVLVYFHLLTTILLSGIYVCYFVPLELRRQFKPDWRQEWKDIRRDKFFVRKYLWSILTHRSLWTLILYIIVIILELAVSPLFGCLLLFEIIQRSKTLRNILNAVKNAGVTLLLTTLFMIFIVWALSTLSFNYVFNEGFVLNTKVGPTALPGQNQFLCDTLAKCVLHLFSYGIRSKYYIENVTPATTYLPRFFLDMFYKVVVVIVIFNIVFSLILDSFSNLREKRAEREKKMKGNCFICDIERNRFDSKANDGISYENHSKENHDKWNYVSFLVHLFQKPHTEYTGVEQFIEESVQKDDITFFP
eukprot:gene3056-5226_t